MAFLSSIFPFAEKRERSTLVGLYRFITLSGLNIFRTHTVSKYTDHTRTECWTGSHDGTWVHISWLSCRWTGRPLVNFRLLGYPTVLECLPRTRFGARLLLVWSHTYLPKVISAETKETGVLSVVSQNVFCVKSWRSISFKSSILRSAYLK